MVYWNNYKCNTIILIFVVLLIWIIIYIFRYFHNKDFSHEAFIEFLKIFISLLIISFIYMLISIFISKGENSQSYNNGIEHTYRTVAYPSTESNLNTQFISRNSPNPPSLDTLPTYKSYGPSNSALTSSINYTINPNSTNEIFFPSCPSYSSNTININSNITHSSNISRSIALSTPTLQQSIIRQTNRQDITSIESLPPPYAP
ncbi:hypothetical protein LY90DRAFT_677298 [Neocallimastix californiae]|uniref:Uncharacterized protein n=1 Tax=Neocallimastix californiae TaxID=1754190 RepID=A0A1Y2A602_9FUNG|nr:hypothetical protein LY90DRAFT_677298 [Neocallimastix californiae]|eukprot:ORY17740.1 hypothetical protein LY90DRAFT_677298 [Neocallimastix californiae]